MLSNVHMAPDQCGLFVLFISVGRAEREQHHVISMPNCKSVFMFVENLCFLIYFNTMVNLIVNKNVLQICFCVLAVTG